MKHALQLLHQLRRCASWFLLRALLGLAANVVLPLATARAEASPPEAAAATPATATLAPVAYSLPEDPKELLRLNDEMRAYFSARVDQHAPLNIRLHAITDAILAPDGLNFQYDSDGVYDVRETFRRRSGNCLAFSMLMIAVAREYRIPAKFNEVNIRPHWNRTGGIVLESHHTNVRVDTASGAYEVDLIPSDNLGVTRMSAQIVDDKRGLCWVYCNTGVYQLAAGNRESAIRLMELSTKVDPNYASAWTNLGGAYLLSLDLERARDCYKRALLADPESPAALSGLAAILHKEGRVAEARKLEQKVVRYRERNPYYLSDLARKEMEKGDFKGARNHLKRAIRIKSEEPEFYEIMAAMSRRQGLEKEAQRWDAKAGKVAAKLAATMRRPTGEPTATVSAVPQE